MAQRNVTIGPIDNGPAGFTPGTIAINVGDMIIWQNTDKTIHSAAAVDDSFETDVIQPLASSLPITFEEAGSFSYACTQHPTETGTITVEDL